MKIKTPYILFPLLLVVMLAACSKKKHKVSKVEVPVVEEVMTKGSEALMEKVIETQIPYTWFAAKGQGRFDLDGQRLNARLHVRILRDSVIWVQLQKFGFEVGRMLITQDSAFFINRFERTYSIYATEEFLVEYNVPADFEMFSKVFTAGAYYLHAFEVCKRARITLSTCTLLPV